MRDFNARRVLFDTNILLDAVVRTRPESYEATEALRFCNGGGDMGLVSPSSLKDAYCVLSRQFDEQTARTAINLLLDLLVILPLDAEATLIAAKSNEPDFEDGMIRSAAELNDIDFILTRDQDAFNYSTVRKLSCREYLEIIESEQSPFREDARNGHKLNRRF